MMKKIIFLLLTVVMFLTNPINNVNAQDNNPITITRQFEISAVKNDNTDTTKNYTVTVTGSITNTSTATISNIKIYLDVKTAFLGIEDTLVITINGELSPNQTYNINLTEELSEKFAKIDKISATVSGGSEFVLFPNVNSSNNVSESSNIDIETPNVGLSVALLVIFAGLFFVAIFTNKSQKCKK